MRAPAFVPPSSVLTVMAHADDAELWAGGTLALCAKQGATVTVAVPRPPEPRALEAAAGAATLGASLRLVEEPTTACVRALLFEIRPDVVLTHPLRDVHADHRRIAEAVLDAIPDVVIAIGCPRRLYTTDTYNGLTLDGPIPAHTIVDVTGGWSTKLRALAEHGSQPILEHFGPMAEALAGLWGRRIGVAHAENFVPVPVLGRLPAAVAL